MKKTVTILLLAILLICFAGCEREDVVLDEAKTYPIASEIHSLDVRINAADFQIKSGDAFSVESNLKFLSVSEENGVLTIVDGAKGNSNYSDATLTLCVPSGTVFDRVNIETGAAQLTADTLSSSLMSLKLGAGDVRFENLNVSTEIDVEGGAGKITVVSGTLNGLTLEMGMGELNLTAAVLGNSDLKLGVGKSDLTLIGNKNDYRIDIEKGLGSITVDGEKVTDFGSSGNGKNYIEIEGGIGAFNLKFQEE